MTTDPQPVGTIQEAAHATVEILTPYCTRIEIGGSIRRGKPNPKDVEIIAIPAAGEVNPLLEKLDDLLRLRQIAKAEYGDAKATRWGSKYRGFMLRGHRIEIFLTTPATWGYTFWLRTGPADANQYVMQRASAKFAPFRFVAGQVIRRDTELQLNVPTEHHLFRLLNVPFVEPVWRSEAYYRQYMEGSQWWSWGEIDQWPIVEEAPNDRLF